jgi:hypothetical protein
MPLNGSTTRLRRWLWSIGLLAISLSVSSCKRDTGAAHQGNAAQRETTKAEERAFLSYEAAINHFLEKGGAEEITPRSTAISRALYFPNTQRRVLLIYFSSNPAKPYIFEGVPEEVWRDFKTARSHGTFYNTRLRGRYQFRLSIR